MTGGYLCLVGLIGISLGAIIRHSAAAIAALAGLILVLPALLIPFPGSVQNAVGRYLPEVIAENSLAISRPEPFSLSPWAGLHVISLAPALAEAIRRIHEGESVSALFDAPLMAGQDWP
jgi:ABC-2 type transport system permease protein